MKTPTESLYDILYEVGLYVPRSSVLRIISDLRETGYIIVRHDSIRLAQAHARDAA